MCACPGAHVGVCAYACVVYVSVCVCVCARARVSVRTLVRVLHLKERFVQPFLLSSSTSHLGSARLSLHPPISAWFSLFVSSPTYLSLVQPVFSLHLPFSLVQPVCSLHLLLLAWFSLFALFTHLSHLGSACLLSSPISLTLVQPVCSLHPSLSPWFSLFALFTHLSHLGSACLLSLHTSLTLAQPVCLFTHLSHRGSACLLSLHTSLTLVQPVCLFTHLSHLRSACLSLHPSLSPSLSLFVSLPISLSLVQPVCLFTHLSAWFSLFALFIHLSHLGSASLSLYPPLGLVLTVCLFTHLSQLGSACLSLHLPLSAWFSLFAVFTYLSQLFPVRPFLGPQVRFQHSHIP